MNTITPAASSPSESLEDQIRQRAYSLWLELGCPNGQEREHWFMAQQELLGARSANTEPRRHADDATPHLSIGNTVADHLSDPTHRFHAPGSAHDTRLDVVAGEARQRVRGRHFDGSLHEQMKKRK